MNIPNFFRRKQTQAPAPDEAAITLESDPAQSIEPVIRWQDASGKTHTTKRDALFAQAEEEFLACFRTDRRFVATYPPGEKASVQMFVTSRARRDPAFVEALRVYVDAISRAEGQSK